MSMMINILGEGYKIEEKTILEESELSDYDGICDPIEKKIIISEDVYRREKDSDKANTMRAQTLRHEIVHAFLAESGLQEESWATCEEIVDWFALQGPKICEVWEAVNAL